MMDDVVASVDEPIGVATRTTADVRDDCSGRRKRSTDDLNSSEELDAPESEPESVALLVTRVIRLQRPIVHTPCWPASATASTDFSPSLTTSGGGGVLC